eukprot:763230-Hanusia_phi.AAC.8
MQGMRCRVGLTRCGCCPSPTWHVRRGRSEHDVTCSTHSDKTHIERTNVKQANWLPSRVATTPRRRSDQQQIDSRTCARSARAFGGRAKPERT